MNPREVRQVEHVARMEGMGISNSENDMMPAEDFDLESDNIEVDRKLDTELWAGYMWLRV